MYSFLCFVRALRKTTGLDLAFKTLDMDVIDDPRLGGSSHPNEHQPLCHQNPSLPMPVSDLCDGI